MNKLCHVIQFYTQNPFEVILTIVGVKIRNDYKWGCDKIVQGCMGLSQQNKSL
jgi:hypothetical protein